MLSSQMHELFIFYKQDYKSQICIIYLVGLLINLNPSLDQISINI